MKKLFIALTCMASLVIMTACGPKSKAEQVIDGFEDLVEEVEKKKGDLTVEEWKEMSDDFNKRFEALGIKDIDEKDFSTLQKIKMVELTVRWGAAMAKSSGTLIDSAMEEAEIQADETNQKSE